MPVLVAVDVVVVRLEVVVVEAARRVQSGADSVGVEGKSQLAFVVVVAAFADELVSVLLDGLWLDVAIVVLIATSASLHQNA